MPYAPKRLTSEDAHNIRKMYNSGLITQREIADTFKISQSLVSKIVLDKVHKNNNKISGTATVKIGFKYGN